jgi:hypothetical protein
MKKQQRIDAIRFAASEIETQSQILLNNSRESAPGWLAIEGLQQCAYNAQFYCDQWAKENDEELNGAADPRAERILRHIEKAGAEGLSRCDIAHKLHAIPVALRDTALQRLIEAGDIEEGTIETGRRPRTVYRIIPKEQSQPCTTETLTESELTESEKPPLESSTTQPA